MLINFFIKYSAYLIFPLITFLLSVFLTKICIKLLPKVGLIDEPRGDRRIHTKAVPKGGENNY